ncbi:uncharacterized protein LOC123376660 isoform X2 [Mauremys mutica]|uniref:uncharacterized protein LOC123376660 isoform X2 n=1 Tax=Mauremys mutica TaxID=74926 RepID=UPI001D161C7B|nr:uncharacterized protein LOC123376660 isoform X2 [Mauremys mutica]
MIERGTDWDTLQCRLKVKKLRNTYHKMWETNRYSGAAPMSCWFYKELDVMLGGDPTSTAKSSVDTSLAHVPVESGLSQEEGILDEEGEGCSQSQQSDLGEVQTEWLCRIRKRLRRTKKDFLREVIMHSAAKKQELKEWQDSKKRDQKENAAHQKEATEHLLNVMERQVDTLQVIPSLQMEQLHAHTLLQPLSQNSFPCAPTPPPIHSYQPTSSSFYPKHSTPPSSQQC